MTVSIFLREEACHCHGQPKRGKDCKPVPLRRLAEGSSSLRHQQRQSRTNLWIFRDFGFLWCLSHWQHPFLLVYPNFKNKKQFRLSSLHSLLPELWSLIFFFFFPFWKPPPRKPSFANNPLFFILFYVLSLAFLPRFAFPQNREWAGPSLVWHHWVFPMRLPQSCSDVRQISLQWACPHCLYSVRDAGMMEVTHESESALHALLVTPHWSHSLCVRLGVKSSPVWSCLYCPLCSSFALTHRVLFWNADII